MSRIVWFIMLIWVWQYHMVIRKQYLLKNVILRVVPIVYVVGQHVVWVLVAIVVLVV